MKIDRFRSPAREDAAAIELVGRQVLTRPWSAGQVAAHLAAATRCDLLAESAACGVAGYILGRIAGDEAELLQVAVARQLQGRGLGTRLLARWLERLGERGVHRTYLEVRPSNRRALSLYRRHGFHLLGRRRRYYRNPQEDALLLARPMAARDRLGAHPQDKE